MEHLLQPGTLLSTGDAVAKNTDKSSYSFEDCIIFVTINKNFIRLWLSATEKNNQGRQLGRQTGWGGGCDWHTL